MLESVVGVGGGAVPPDEDGVNFEGSIVRWCDRLSCQLLTGGVTLGAHRAACRLPGEAESMASFATTRLTVNRPVVFRLEECSG